MALNSTDNDDEKQYQFHKIREDEIPKGYSVGSENVEADDETPSTEICTAIITTDTGDIDHVGPVHISRIGARAQY